MRKSHQWNTIKILAVRCPHCGRLKQKEGFYDEGYFVSCPFCGKRFELGRRK